MVGLYETAIHEICCHKGVVPKIIASTATIRRAREQCSALYNCDVKQFPPPGVEADDSYFSRMAKINHKEGKYGRLYIGMMPSGKTKAMLEVRSIAALLQEVYEMQLDDEQKDMLWTLTIYFNSLRELGQCTNLVEDDVKDTMRRMAHRQGCQARAIGSPCELTSRVSTTDLNTILERLEKITYCEQNIAQHRYPVNVLLSSNMISAGIDVARLNIMLMVGQPKLTSEYIQASSRVGRSLPGTVLTLYDGMRSRDRSYYEQFKSYHEAFYKYVEPTGLTPFSEPARERALHAVIIAIMRNIISGLSAENDAKKFDKKDFQDVIDKIKHNILERITQIRQRTNLKLKDDHNNIEREIDDFFVLWDELAHQYQNTLVYGNKYMRKEPVEDEARLLKPFSLRVSNESARKTLTSMRNVDDSIKGNVIVWEDFV